MLGPTLLTGLVLAQPTVSVPTDAATLTEALERVDEGGTILIEGNLDVAQEPCVEVHKSVSIVGQGQLPVVPGLFPQYVILSLENLTIAGPCVGRRSTYLSSSEVTSHVIVHGGELTGVDLSLPGHDGHGVVLSDADVVLTRVQASNNDRAVFYATVAQADTTLQLSSALLDANEDGVILGMRSDYIEPPLRIVVEDSLITNAAGDPAAVAQVNYGELVIRNTTMSGRGSDGGAGALPSNGLIYSYGGDLLIEGSRISDCLGRNNGAIGAQGLGSTSPTSVTVRDTTIERCGADTTLGVGGLLSATDIAVTLEDVVAREVFASQGALLWHDHGEQLTVRDVAVLGYETGGRAALFADQVNEVSVTRARLCGGTGAGVSVGLETQYAVDTTIRNLVVQDLDAPASAAVLVTGGKLELRNSTLAANNTRELLVYDGLDLNVFNDLFTGSPGAVGVRSVRTPTAWLGGYNLWYDLGANTAGFGDLEDPATDVALDPAFVATWQADDCSTLPRLAAGSPAIDAGNPAADLADPDGTRGDIGAFGGPDGGWPNTDSGDDSGADDSGDDSGGDDSAPDDSPTDDSDGTATDDSSPQDPDDSGATGSKPSGCAGCASAGGGTGVGALLLALISLRRRSGSP